MPQLELVVIGASAGGLQALLDIVRSLPAGLSASIVVVVHINSEGDSLLPKILSRESQLPVEFAADGAIRRGRIYVAPPNRHVLVTSHGLRLNSGPRENGFRPAVDPLFRTAARVYGSRVMGVILSGALDDGTYGLKLLKDAGGTAVAQDPDEASFPSMPLSAIRFVHVDHVLRAEQIASLIADLSSTSVEGGNMARHQETEPQDPEPQDPAEETRVDEMEEHFGAASGITCPDCGGALWEIPRGALTRYRCHVGHQFTIEGLDAGQQSAVEGALWSAVRVLEEHAALRQRMAARAGAAGMDAVSTGFSSSADDSRAQAHTIRQLLFSRVAPAAEGESLQPLQPATAGKRRAATANGKARKLRRRAR